MRRETTRTRAVRTAAALTAAAALALTACSAERPSSGRTGVVPGPATGAADSPAQVAPTTVSPTPTPSPTPVWDTTPSSLVALGDSITRGFDACALLKDCPDQSWPAVLAARLGARESNLARSGARMDDLAGQARRAVALAPQQVVILMGANDACRRTVGEMTTPADFRRQFAAAMRVLSTGLPKAQVMVASVPDLRRLLEVGRTLPLAKEIWQLGICRTMLDDPDATSAAVQQRRAAVEERVESYNTALEEVCEQYERCRWDGGAVFGYRFSAGELSPFDFFHPSRAGQAQLARIVAQAGFSSSTVTE